LGEVALQRVVAGHLVELAALLVEPHPEPPADFSAENIQRSDVKSGWQSRASSKNEGDVDRLRLPYRMMLTEQGFTITYSHVSKLNLEVPTGP
jgi:hypothetical protein